MKQDEMIEMAKQAGWQYAHGDSGFEPLWAFAKLVAAAAASKEREAYMQLFLDPENQPTQFGTATQEYREQEIKDEREACAKLADDIDPVWESVSDAIRARGEA